MSAGKAHASSRRRSVLLGRSVNGRPIEAVAHGSPDADLRILVVGSIHGNETAGHAVIRRLRELGAPGVRSSGRCAPPIPTARSVTRARTPAASI